LCIGLSVRGIERSADKLPDRCSHLAPMPKRDAKLFEVLIGQMAEDGNINIVFGKTLNVLGHAELLSQSAMFCMVATNVWSWRYRVFDQGVYTDMPTRLGSGWKRSHNPHSHARTGSASTL
jgi:hypothetical protein